MDPTSWSAYSQHLSRLGAINHPSGALSQQAQMNDLALTSSLQRQEHIAGYGNAGGPHPFLLAAAAAASHGLNPSQANHSDPSFNANLFANYDASLFSSFPPGNKGHLSFPQGAAGLFKAVNRENEFSDLRTGFAAHCGMSPYSRNSDANNGLPSGSGHLFPNSVPPGAWRHSGIIPSSCGPFGVLPHETVLQRSHLVGRASDKLSVQASKQARASLQNAAFVEQDLSRGYRTILSSPARPQSSFVDGSNTSHSSLLSPQNDPFFSSVNENFFSSCSKNDFAAYSSYCSNVQSGVQRSSLSPYCYSPAFANFEPNAEKQDTPTTSTNSSANNANFSNFVPNSNVNGNTTHLHNGQISRQSVITSNVSNNSMIFESESHQQSPSYNIKEPYPFQASSAHANSCASNPNTNSSSGSGNARQATAAHNSHHSSGHSAYPPMSTPIPASTPAHTTPPSSMGQAYVPIPLPMSHDSGCSSVNSQSVMYHSPSNDGCYSTPGTCPSDSGSPSKQDMSQHSSPSVYSVDSSNLSINSGPYADGHPVRAHSNSDGNFTKGSGTNGRASSEMQESASESTKLIEEKLKDVSRRLIATTQQKDLASMLPLDMVKVNKESPYQPVNAQAVLNLPAHDKRANPRSGGSASNRNESFALSDTPSVLDFTPKIKSKRDHKHSQNGNSLPLNCTFSHLQNSRQHSTSPNSSDKEKPHKLDESETDYENTAVAGDMPNISDSSPLPVDLSQVTMNLRLKKSESSTSSEKKDNVFELNYDSIESSSEKWSIKKTNSPESENIKNIDTAENLSRDSDIKKIGKCQSPICRTPPLDDLSEESKKLCNSIEDDLGFLAGLSSDPDVEDSASKGSFSEKKSKKDQGFLQSFLTFLESSNEPPPGSTDPVNLESKNEKPESSESQLKSDEKKDNVPVDKVEDSKSGLIDQHDDKDNFDEAPSLDPTLFGCTTLQKEMVVPNPEAPSFSSDEDENSTQGIFDSVAMAIQRLCEDNEDEHSDKNKNATLKCSSSMDNPTSLANAAEPSSSAEQMTENEKLPVEDKTDDCSIKSACVVKGRKSKRRKARHLLVIKVKRAADRSPNSVTKQPIPEKSMSTRSSVKDVQILKTVQKGNSRRPLMRKCKERGLRKRSSASARSKFRKIIFLVLIYLLCRALIFIIKFDI